MRVCDITNIPHMDEQKALFGIKKLIWVLEQTHTEYWFDYGSLLGIIRDHMFIPWDTDIETYAYYNNELQKYDLASWFVHAGLKTKMYPVHMEILEDKNCASMSVSWVNKFFFTKPLSLVCYHLPTFVRMGIIKAVQELYSKSKSEFIRPDDGFKRDKKIIPRILRIMMPIFFCGKLKKVRFYDFEVPVPAKAEELLFLRYGKDWRIPKQKYESYTT